jgi:hypothetical protein
VKPRGKRTTAQVNAEKKTKEAVRKQLVELREAELMLYTQMELDEEIEDLEDDKNAVR